MLDNPESKSVSETLNSISMRLRDSKRMVKREKFLIFFLFATHGYLRDGMQFVLINEFDRKENYYKRFAMEAKLREWAYTNPHAYIVTIFACCR